MALQKAIPTQYGVAATYWKVTELTINWHLKLASVTLSGWVDQDARRGGFQFVERRTIPVGASDEWPFDPDRNTVKDSYALARARMDEFTDADDV